MQERVKPKTKVTLDIDATLAAAAAVNGVDLVSLLEQALAAQLRVGRKQALNDEDRSAIEATNRYVTEHGPWWDDRENL